MTEHELKTWPEFFQAIVENRKPFDYRLNDRDFKVGDVLFLREWVPPTVEVEPWAPKGTEAGYYTGRSVRKSVTYILDDKIGPTMREGFVVMGLGDESGAEMVLVPITPTAEMIEAAWAEAHDENAEGVWRDMVNAARGIFFCEKCWGRHARSNVPCTLPRET